MNKEFQRPSESNFFKKNDGLLSSDPLFLRTQIKINTSSESLLDEQGRLSCEGKQKTAEIFSNSRVDAAESVLALKELGTEVSEKLSSIRKETKKATEDEWKSLGAKLRPNREVIREQISSKLKANEEWQKLKIQQKFAVSLSQKFKNKIKSEEAKKVEVVVSQNDLAAYKEKMGAWGTEARLRRSLVNFEVKRKIEQTRGSISDQELVRFKQDLVSHDFDPNKLSTKDLKEILALRKISVKETTEEVVVSRPKSIFDFSRIQELVKDRIPNPLWEESRQLNLRQRFVLAGSALAAILAPIAANSPSGGEKFEVAGIHEEIIYQTSETGIKIIPEPISEKKTDINNVNKEKAVIPAPKKLASADMPAAVQAAFDEKEIQKVEESKAAEEAVKNAAAEATKPAISPTPEITPSPPPAPTQENALASQITPEAQKKIPPVQSPVPTKTALPAPKGEVAQKAPVLVLKTPTIAKVETPAAMPTQKPVEKTPVPATPVPVEKTPVPPAPTAVPTKEAPVAAAVVQAAAPVVEAPEVPNPAPITDAPEIHVRTENSSRRPAPEVVQKAPEAKNDSTCGGKYNQSNAPEGNFADQDCDYSIEGAKQLIRELDPANASTWIEIMNRESSGRPNITARSVNGIAYGLMQMGRGLNGVYDNGKVAWRKQIANAIEYNRRLGNRAWQYWQAARDMGLWGKR